MPDERRAEMMRGNVDPQADGLAVPRIQHPRKRKRQSLGQFGNSIGARQFRFEFVDRMHVVARLHAGNLHGFFPPSTLHRVTAFCYSVSASASTM